jgi:manganese/zinc/iron transport system permease protein
LPALLTAVFAAAAAALPGNFLVLRKQSLLGDAISHAVLPGIIIGFILAQDRVGPAIMIGALAAAVAAALFIDLVRSIGRIESTAAMGVVFSIFFAAGIVLMELASASLVDLDADCVLYGQLEHVFWLELTSWSALAEPATWLTMPRQLATLAIVLALTAALMAAFWKELVATSFDPEHAAGLGLPTGLINAGLMVVVAIVSVAAFEAVGSILVIAMFIAPAAAARMLTDRLGTQVAISLFVAVAAAVSGYGLAGFGPRLFGSEIALSASGMMATMAGLLFLAAVLFAPERGVLARRGRAYAAR